MTTNDEHIQHTWNLTHTDGDSARIDLWTDDETVHVEGGDSESYSGSNARQVIERMLAKYTAAGYRVDSDYPVNDGHDTAGE